MQGFIDPDRAEIAAASGVYTSDLAEAVTQFQRANGLRADGNMGPKTLAKLTRDPNRDRQRIVLNMHRARLIPNEMERLYLMANLPSGEVFGFQNQTVETRMRIVFGRNTEGPRFSAIRWRR